MHHPDSLDELRAEVRRLDKRWHTAHQPLNDALVLARRLQQSHVQKSLPQAPGLRCTAFHRPSRDVGGDFYDVFRLVDNRIGFFVGDALGHSVPAALLTLLVRQVVHSQTAAPAETLSYVNRELLTLQLRETPLLTMIYGQVDLPSGRVTVARAGQPSPIYLPRDGAPSQWQIEGPLLGVLDSQFDQSTRQLQQGDQLILCSDGIDSATFENFPAGIDSLLACAAREHSSSVADTVGGLVQRLFTPPGGAEDVTLLGFEVPVAGDC